MKEYIVELIGESGVKAQHKVWASSKEDARRKAAGMYGSPSNAYWRATEI